MKKGLHFRWFILVAFGAILVYCSDSPLNNDGEGESNIARELVSGVVQKGPFNSGSNVILYELNGTTLSQTGRSFNTQIKDNQGKFEFTNIELSSPYAEFRADGFFFNEILGKLSASQITLQALADISGETEVNVNVLSHLEKPRIETLVSEGLSFTDAKQQAQQEILNVFHIVKEDVVSSEIMNITMDGEDNAILLAISSILLGYRSEAELSELLSNLITDLSNNGELNNDALGSQLINHAVYLRSDKIRANLEQRYSDIGISASIPEFEHYIENFIENTPFEFTERLIHYPAHGNHGVNILDPDQTNYVMSESGYVSFAADLPAGTSLKVRLSVKMSGSTGLQASLWKYVVAPDGPVNWSVKPYNNGTQEFIVIDSGKSSDLKIHFRPGSYIIEYFEMNPDAEEPVFTSEFTVSI